MNELEQQALAKRNVRTALALGVIALGILAAFVWSVMHR